MSIHLIFDVLNKTTSIMKQQAYQSTGISLITGAILIIITMIMHPSGGSMERILSISKTITSAHAIAIFCLPIVLFGFYGLAHRYPNPTLFCFDIKDPQSIFK